MTIKLSGYRTIFPNAVYTRDENFTMSGGTPIKGTRVLLFHRYTEATEDEVILYLKGKERQLPLTVPSPPVLQNLSYLERAIIGLPTEERGRLRRGDSELVRFLRRNTPTRVLGTGEEPSQYLSLAKGLIPTELIRVNQKRSNIYSSEWYKRVFQDDDLNRAGLGEQWQMRVAYTNKGLPPRSEMDILMKHGTFGSETLRVSTSLRKHIFKDIVETLYAGFPTPDEISLLEDTSAKVLENEATRPMQALLAHLQMSHLRQAIRSGEVIVLGGQSREEGSARKNSGGDPIRKPN